MDYNFYKMRCEHLERREKINKKKIINLNEEIDRLRDIIKSQEELIEMLESRELNAIHHNKDRSRETRSQQENYNAEN